MKTERASWIRTALAAALSSAVWAIAASNGYALEMIWLPSVALGAACLPRLSNLITKEPQ